MGECRYESEWGANACRGGVAAEDGTERLRVPVRRSRPALTLLEEGSHGFPHCADEMVRHPNSPGGDPWDDGRDGKLGWSNPRPTPEGRRAAAEDRRSAEGRPSAGSQARCLDQ